MVKLNHYPFWLAVCWLVIILSSYPCQGQEQEEPELEPHQLVILTLIAAILFLTLIICIMLIIDFAIHHRKRQQEQQSKEIDENCEECCKPDTSNSNNNFNTKNNNDHSSRSQIQDDKSIKKLTKTVNTKIIHKNKKISQPETARINEKTKNSHNMEQPRSYGEVSIINEKFENTKSKPDHDKPVKATEIYPNIKVETKVQSSQKHKQLETDIKIEKPTTMPKPQMERPQNYSEVSRPKETIIDETSEHTKRNKRQNSLSKVHHHKQPTEISLAESEDKQKVHKSKKIEPPRRYGEVSKSQEPDIDDASKRIKHVNNDEPEKTKHVKPTEICPKIKKIVTKVQPIQKHKIEEPTTNKMEQPRRYGGMTVETEPTEKEKSETNSHKITKSRSTNQNSEESTKDSSVLRF